MKTPRAWTLALVVAATLATAQTVSATTIAVGTGAFGAGSTLTTFTGLASGTEVNGLTVDGLNFQYSLGNGQVIIDGGPGTTNNITAPNIVSIGRASGVLTVVLPSLVDAFGYGYALETGSPVTGATTIALFNGATAVGSLSYNSTPDPVFSGGFAGILSTLPFDRVELTFNSAAAPAFALDNIRTAAPIPEPATLLLLGTGVVGLIRARRTTKRENRG